MAKGKERAVEQRIQRTSYTRTVKQIEKQCAVCQRSFWGTKMSLYCSRACRNKAHYGRHADDYRTARMEKYHAEKKAAAGKQ